MNRLILSAMGGWFDARGVWDHDEIVYGGMDDGHILSVQEWRHIATMGRDQFVRVVYAGYLYPFGHRASLVKVTERKFYTPEFDSEPKTAVLRQRMFIVVKEPEKKYPSATGTEPVDQTLRHFPFTSVKILTTITPSLDKPGDQEGFWPYVNEKKFKFHIIAEDIEQNKVEFDLPLFFGSSAFPDKGYSTSIVTNMTLSCGINGTSMAFADESKTGDTTLEVHNLTFDAVTEKKFIGDSIPPYYPLLYQAEVIIPAVKIIGHTDNKVTIEFEENYLEKGFSGAEVFATLATTPDLTFSGNADRSGGLIAPDMKISGLSRIMGPVGDVDSLVDPNNSDPQIDISKFFNDATLFGCIPLKKIINPLSIFNSNNNKNLPKMILSSDPSGPKTTYLWEEVPLKNFDSKKDEESIFIARDNANLTLKATIYLHWFISNVQLRILH